MKGALLAIMEIQSWDQEITVVHALAQMDQKVGASLQMAVTKIGLHCKWCVFVRKDTKEVDVMNVLLASLETLKRLGGLANPASVTTTLIPLIRRLVTERQDCASGVCITHEVNTAKTVNLATMDGLFNRIVENVSAITWERFASVATTLKIASVRKKPVSASAFLM